MTLEDAIKLANEKRDDFKQFTHWEECEHAFVFRFPGIARMVALRHRL